MKTIKAVIDLTCPWCYIGKRKLDLALNHQNLKNRFRLDWLPFQLYPNIPDQGIEPFELSHAFTEEVIQKGKEVGIHFRFDRIKRVPNTLRAHRLLWWARKMRAESVLIDHLFQAYFLEGRDIGKVSVLLDIVERIGLDVFEAAGLLLSERGRREVRELQRGVTSEEGVRNIPSYVIDQKKITNEPQSVIEFMHDKERSW